MLKKLSLWQRIVIPVLAMALGISVVSGLLVSQYYARFEQAQGMTRSADTILVVSHVIHEIQKERGASTLFLNGANTKEELNAKRDIADQKLQLLLARKDLLPHASVQVQINEVREQHQKIRTMVDNRSTEPTEIARHFGQVIEGWIKVQVACSSAYHLDGLESTLLSISIFEKSKESMGRMRALLNAVLGSNQPITSSLVSLLATHKSGVLTNLESPGLSISTSSQQNIDKLLASEDWKQVEATYNRVIEKSMTGNYGVDAKEYSATITRVIDGVRDVIIPQIEQTALNISNAAAAARRALIICVTSVISLVILAMIMAGYVTKRVNSSLNGVAELLNHGADAVARIAVQVAAASQNLAASASQQASAMQETSAAVNETQSMIKKNSDNSQRSTEISHKSLESALRGRSLIDEMAGSMGDIASSNEEIIKQNDLTNKDLLEIIKVIRDIEGKTRVINDIVFQTRLLSFNASVEAARAAEQGKGFAVVAEEVGNLAQMSGAAAREIQIMLDSSVHLVESIVTNTREKLLAVSQTGKQKIEAGVQRTERCGRILQEIVENVTIVEKMSSEISIACREQSEGISEINGAMSEMDAAAHQNSAACEQTSASAEELKNHADKLLSMVHQLEIVIHGTQGEKAKPVIIQPKAVIKADDEWDQAA